ncbi:adenylyl-sulfate kinase [Rosenbergiella nectarea]|uniref:Adenylyl-sulfate kinase n=1 Tax=Rosenbergiella nectarea TaxID=988801 RepID=A0A1H9ISR5_9GAMM|nr:adenylyl-sulfate kinase [Rosenbergiella nectarea]MBT0729810.1 adenylyl-sulfate kinase [Rosenbergiella nectarea subsp. apis]SEQ77558.1 adenylylsulfate kinase [Rosenbergiella nectarea]
MSRQAENIVWHEHAVTPEMRETLHRHRGAVVWFTGLSGSGKSTLSGAVEQALHQLGSSTFLLDGDNIRQGLCRDLGFSDNDRKENIRRISEVAKLMADAGLIVLTAFISPHRSERQLARELIGEERFIEIFVDTAPEICEARDPKGLYRKARAGEIKDFTGIGSGYEAPLSPELRVDGEQLVTKLSEQIINLLRERAIIAA